MFHSNVEEVIKLWISCVLLLEGDTSLLLTLYLKIDGTVCNASIFMTFSRVWEDVFTVSHDGGRLTHRVGLIWQTLISPSLSLPFAVPPVDLRICRPRSTLEKRNEDPWNEMPNAAFLVTWRKKCERTKKRKAKKHMEEEEEVVVEEELQTIEENWVIFVHQWH